MSHWSDDMRRADADEIASAIGLELEHDAPDGLDALKAHAVALAAEHAALQQRVEELRYGAASWHKARQAGADEERRRCLAWLRYTWQDAAIAGIESGEWPPEEGA